jgi:hypothetical protein
MNRVRDLVDLTSIYEAVKEKKITDPKAKFGTKPGKPKPSLPEVKIKEPLKDDGQPKQPFFHKDSGPENADGFVAPAVDPKVTKGKENHYEPEKFSDPIEKKVRESINNFMNNKSIFDKLYEEVMGGVPSEQQQDDLDAMELDVQADAGSEGGSEEVTLTLPKDLAQKLHEVLAGVLGDGEAEDAGEELGKPEGNEDAAGEEQEEGKKDKKEEKKDEKKEVAGEAIDAEEIGHAIVDGEKLNKGLNKVSSGSNVVPGEVSTAGKKAGKGGDGKVTDKVGNDGDLGHPLVNQKKGDADSVKGKSNVVNSKIKGNNQSFFNV